MGEMRTVFRHKSSRTAQRLDACANQFNYATGPEARPGDTRSRVFGGVRSEIANR